MTETERYELAMFLESPDEPRMPPRRYHLTQQGDPERRQRHRQRMFVAWLMHRDLAVDGDFAPRKATKLPEWWWAYSPMRRTHDERKINGPATAHGPGTQTSSLGYQTNRRAHVPLR